MKMKYFVTFTLCTFVSYRYSVSLHFCAGLTDVRNSWEPDAHSNVLKAAFLCKSSDKFNKRVQERKGRDSDCLCEEA